MTLITGTITDSAGAPANGRIEFVQAQRLDTGYSLVTQTVATAQVVDGQIRALDGSPFDMPANPEGTAVRLREILGGRTFEWWTQIPATDAEYRSLIPVEPVGTPLYAPPPWLTDVFAARGDALTASGAAVASASSAASAKSAAETARDEAVAVGNTNDTIMAAVASNGVSAFAGVLSSTIDGEARPIVRSRGRAHGVFRIGEDYGGDPTGATVSTTSVLAAFADAAAWASGSFNSQTSKGATVVVDGIFLVNSPIKLVSAHSGLKILGNGRTSSRLVNNTTDLIQILEGSMPIDVFAANVSFETGAAGGHVLSVGTDITLTSALTSGAAVTSLVVSPLPASIASGATVSTVIPNVSQQDWTTTAAVAAGATSIPVASQTANTNYPIGSYVTPPSAAIRTSKFDHCRFLTRNPASSLIRQRGNSNFLATTFDTCDLDRAAGTVPAVDIQTVSGSLHNSNLWLNCWAHGHNTSAAPFFYLRPRSGWYYDTSFVNVTGEQNGGGFIHLYACDAVIIENCPDWDYAPAYAGSLFKLAPVGSAVCNNWEITNSFRLANAGGLGAGVFDIEAGSATQRNGHIFGCKPPGVAPVYSLNGDVKIDGEGQGFKTITAAGTTTLTLSDPRNIVVNTASAVTLALPAVTAAALGREFNVVNVGAGVVTIATTVSGTAGRTLNQWDRMTIRTDGSTALFGRIWFMV
ncbi:hypothetical protein ACTJI8_02880 [Microbacterium sp. 22303]|uniref:hypothetical protein n=1 Tax=Microbacterium sp. 22303 TaxID=3453905 RepID=UPI003F824A34